LTIEAEFALAPASAAAGWPRILRASARKAPPGSLGVAELTTTNIGT